MKKVFPKSIFTVFRLKKLRIAETINKKLFCVFIKISIFSVKLILLMMFKLKNKFTKLAFLYIQFYQLTAEDVGQITNSAFYLTAYTVRDRTNCL